MGASVNHRKFITEAIRHPEKELGDASNSVSPEYLFSESKGRSIHQETDDNDLQYIPLSRLSLEVREAVDSDPMYGGFKIVFSCWIFDVSIDKPHFIHFVVFCLMHELQVHIMIKWGTTLG